MLYTFSQADYDQQTLEIYVRNANATDAIVLWQDGVLLAIKQADVLARCQAPCFVLENDLLARNLTALLPENAKVRSMSLSDFVANSQQKYPQIAL